MPSQSKSAADWRRLRPDAAHAVNILLGQLQEEAASEQNIVDAYLYAKKLLAEAIQAMISAGLPERFGPFHQMRSDLQAELNRRYGDRVNAKYLTVPYGSRVHEQLFTMLVQRIGTPVSADLLRIATGDSVHTERRIRELRELGLNIESRKANGTDVYILSSLELDLSLLPVLVKNNIRTKSKAGAVALLNELGL